MNDDLVFDISEASKFLALFDEDGRHAFQTFYEAKGLEEHYKARSNGCGWPIPPKVLSGPFDKLASELSSRNSAGCAVWFCVNETNGEGRTAKHITHIRAFFVDFDEDGDVGLAKALSSPLPPQVVVESSPGKFHAYWLLRDPISVKALGGTDAANKEFNKWQCALASRFGGDDSVSDLSRVMRVPGFIHRKGTPFKTRVIANNAYELYDFEQIVDKLNLSEHLLDDKTSSKRQGKYGIDAYIDGSKRIKKGKRNAELHQLAQDLFRLGLSERSRLVFLREANATACDEPISEVELKTINRNGEIYDDAGRRINEERAVGEQAAAGLSARQAEVEQQSREIIASEAPKMTWELRPAAYSPPGLVGEVYRYILGACPKVQPEIALAASLVACATIMGQKVQTETHLRTNIYCLCVALTGAGKEGPRTAVRKIFEAIGLERMVSVDDIASDAAVAEAVAEQPCQAMFLDEFGQLMSTVSSKNAGAHLANIPKVFMRLYSTAQSTFYSKSCKDTKLKKTVRHPNLSILATTTPNSFFKSITSENAQDGLLNRVLLFYSNHPLPEENPAPQLAPPDALIDKFRAWHKLTCTGGNLPSVITVKEDEDGDEITVDSTPVARTVIMTPEARALFEEEKIKIRSQFDALNKDGTWGLFTRLEENAVKIALIVACGRSMYQPVIDVQDAEYGIAIVRDTTDNLRRAVLNHVADSEVESKLNMVLDVLRRSSPNWVARTKVSIRCKRRLRGNEVGAILNELVAFGSIAVRDSASTTRPGKEYLFLREPHEADV